MRLHTNEFKNQIKELGRELDSRITFNDTIITSDELFSITPINTTDLLKSVMKGFNFETTLDIPLETQIKYEFGLKVNNEFEYIDYDNYIIYKKEFNENNKIWNYTCYDKMINSMKDYEKLNIEYPITINNYIKALANYLELNFLNDGETYPNYNKIIKNELYLDENGNSLGYTFRDVFDELSQVVAGNIMVKNDDLFIKYPTETNDIIDEEYIKNVNSNFGEKYGKINSVVLSRSAGTDNIYMKDDESIEENGLTEIKIEDNQILNDDDRGDYLEDIFNKLNGLEFYLNDYISTGIMYYELLDLYNVLIDGYTYKCLMLNDEPKITQGLVENVYTPEPKINNTDYNIANKDDRLNRRTSLIVDKINNSITSIVSDVDDTKGLVEEVSVNQTANSLDINTITTKDENGNITGVKTSTGFTFNNNGLSIYRDKSSYNTLHNNEGSYYKDGDTTVGLTNQNGSIYKDFALYGSYYYGIEDNIDVENFKKDEAMFVSEKFVDENGEECVGHFYNGRD